MEKNWTMTLKGGDLPKDFEAKIAVVCEFNPDTDREAMITYCFGGSSARVALQAQLRSWSVDDLRKLEVGGLKCTLSGIKAGAYRKGKTQAAPMDTYKASLKAMPRAEAIAKIMDDTGFDEEVCEKFLDRI